jgi:hypothetical protein
MRAEQHAALDDELIGVGRMLSRASQRSTM